MSTPDINRFDLMHEQYLEDFLPDIHQDDCILKVQNERLGRNGADFGVAVAGGPFGDVGVEALAVFHDGRQ